MGIEHLEQERARQLMRVVAGDTQLHQFGMDRGHIIFEVETARSDSRTPDITHTAEVAGYDARCIQYLGTMPAARAGVKLGLYDELTPKTVDQLRAEATELGWRAIQLSTQSVGNNLPAEYMAQSRDLAAQADALEASISSEASQ